MANESNESPKPKLGQRLKSLRETRGIKLPDLAELTGIARSTLYKVENSGMSLTYDKLIDLAGGLGVKVADLFQEESLEEDQTIVMGRREIGRKGEGFHLETKNYDYHYLCPELKSKKLTPILGRIRSRSTDDFEDLFKHEGEEFNYVVEGAIEVHTEYYSPVRLEQGDYIYLDSTMPHGFISVSTKPALVLSICTSPTGKAMDQDAVIGED